MLAGSAAQDMHFRAISLIYLTAGQIHDIVNKELSVYARSVDALICRFSEDRRHPDGASRERYPS